MLQRDPYFVRGSRHRERRFAELLSIAQIELGPARHPPRSSWRAVIHPLPNLRIRAVPQQFHERRHLVRSQRLLIGLGLQRSRFTDDSWHMRSLPANSPAVEVP